MAAAAPKIDQNDFEKDLAADIAEFYDDPYGFIMYIFPWGQKDTPLEDFPDGPDTWQAEQLIRIGEAFKNDPLCTLREAIASGHGIGKTAEVAFIILWAMSTRPHLAGVVTANTLPQLTTKTWRELAVWHKRSINAHWFKWSATKFYHVEHSETWFVAAVPNTEHNSEAFAGLHATHVLVIYDEGSGIPDKIWEVSEGAMTTPRAMWFVYGNPTKNTGRFRECFHSDSHRWTTRQIDSRQAKMTNKAEMSEWVNTYGEDSDFVRVRVRGVFPRTGDMQFIASDLVDRGMKWECPYEAHFQLPILIGVDVARYGDDKTVIAVRQGRKLLELRKFRELNTMQVATMAADAIREYRPAATFVDGIGVGAGVVDRLRMLNYEIIEVNAGVKASDEDTYFNKRAEMWDRVRIWLRDGADIPDDAELRQALIGIEYSFDGKELMRMERKQDMKRRGLESPDEGDAICLTFAEEIGDYTNNWFEPDDQFEPEDMVA
jgi:hypothetical protein